MSDAEKARWRLVGGMMLAGTALVATVFVLGRAGPPAIATDARGVEAKSAIANTLAFWAVAPPIWFMAEWAFLRPSNPDGDDAKAMIRSQELASKIWAGVLVALGVLYVGKVGGIG